MFRLAVLFQALLTITLLFDSSLTAAGQAKCSDGAGAAPTLDPITAGTYRVRGRQATPGKKIHVCVDDNEADPPTADVGADGMFDLALKSPLKAGQSVKVQQDSATVGGPTWGKLSDPVTVNTTGLDCTGAAPSGTATAPTLNPIQIGDESVTGALAGAKGGEKFRVCVDGKEAQAKNQTGPTEKSANFAVTLAAPLGSGQTVTVQQVTSTDGGTTYGPFSSLVKVGEEKVSSAYSWGRVRVILSGGAIVSQDQGNFSKTSTYLDLTTDNTWYMKDHCNDWTNEDASGASRPYRCPVTVKVGVPSFKSGAQINSTHSLALG